MLWLRFSVPAPWCTRSCTTRSRPIEAESRRPRRTWTSRGRSRCPPRPRDGLPGTRGRCSLERSRVARAVAGSDEWRRERTRRLGRERSPRPRRPCARAPRRPRARTSRARGRPCASAHVGRGCAGFAFASSTDGARTQPPPRSTARGNHPSPRSAADASHEVPSQEKRAPSAMAAFTASQAAWGSRRRDAQGRVLRARYERALTVRGSRGSARSSSRANAARSTMEPSCPSVTRACPASTAMP